MRTGLHHSVRQDGAAVDAMMAAIHRFQQRAGNLPQIDQTINRYDNEESIDAPLSSKAFRRQNFKTYKGEKDEVCSVCLTALKTDDQAMKLTCGHTFHHQCVYRWFERAHICPNCRCNLETEVIQI